MTAQSLFQKPVVVVDGQRLQPVSAGGVYASLAEMREWMKSPAVFDILLDGVSQMPTVSRDTAAILVAGVIEYPVESWSIRVTRQVGRFVLVEYEPLGQADPDVIITLAPAGVPTTAYNAAMQRYQSVRVGQVRADPKGWRRKVHRAARNLIKPLYGLQATPDEAAFVLRWALHNAATGRALPAQQPAQRPAQGRQSKPTWEPDPWGYYDSLAAFDNP